MKKKMKKFKDMGKDMKQTVAELKSLKSPPAQVGSLVSVNAMMFGHTDNTWKTSIVMLQKEAHKYAIYDPKALSKQVLAAIKKEKINPAELMTKSMAAGNLSQWIVLAVEIKEL